MQQRVNILVKSSPAYSLRVAELAIASVWVLSMVLANASEKCDAFHLRLPVTPAAK
jgi:hypothetical protein